MIHSTRRRLAIAAIAGSALLASVSAFAAEPAIGDFLGRSEAEISATLTRQGFTFEEVEHEHGEYRVDLRQAEGEEGTGWFEIHIDPTSGLVLKVDTDFRDHESRYGRDDDGDRHHSRKQDHDG